MTDQRDVCGCHRDCTDIAHPCTAPCRWPECLSAEQKDQLVREILLGEI